MVAIHTTQHVDDSADAVRGRHPHHKLHILQYAVRLLESSPAHSTAPPAGHTRSVLDALDASVKTAPVEMISGLRRGTDFAADAWHFETRE